jgi:hypothetical protein
MRANFPEPVFEVVSHHPEPTQCPRPEEYFPPEDKNPVGSVKDWTCACGRQWHATLVSRESVDPDMVFQFVGWSYDVPGT